MAPARGAFSFSWKASTFGSGFFEVPVQKLPHYRVRVFAYDWIQSADLLF